MKNNKQIEKVWLQHVDLTCPVCMTEIPVAWFTKNEKSYHLECPWCKLPIGVTRVTDKQNNSDTLVVVFTLPIEDFKYKTF